MKKQWHFDYWEEPQEPEPQAASPEEQERILRKSEEFIKKALQKVRPYTFVLNPEKERRFLRLVGRLRLFSETYNARAEAELDEGRGSITLFLKSPFYVYGDDGHLLFLQFFGVCEDITLEYNEDALKFSGLADLRDTLPPREEV